MWALGSLGFSLLGHEPPYTQQDNTTLPSVPWAVGEGGATPRLISQMLSWEPSERPSAVAAAAWVSTRERMIVEAEMMAVRRAASGR